MSPVDPFTVLAVPIRTEVDTLVMGSIEAFLPQEPPPLCWQLAESSLRQRQSVWLPARLCSFCADLSLTKA